MLYPEAFLFFVTSYIAIDFRVSPKILAEPFLVSTLVGKSIVSQRVYQNCPIMVSHKVTLVDLEEIEMIDFDVILGMDWIHSFYALVDCRNKIVYF